MTAKPISHNLFKFFPAFLIVNMVKNFRRKCPNQHSSRIIDINSTRTEIKNCVLVKPSDCCAVGAFYIVRVNF